MIVAFPTNNQKTINEKIGFSKYILLIDTDTGEKKLLDNPVFEKASHLEKVRDCGENGLETGKILPKILKEYNVQKFYGIKFGEGLLDNLEIYGIEVAFTDKKEIEANL